MPAGTRVAYGAAGRTYGGGLVRLGSFALGLFTLTLMACSAAPPEDDGEATATGNDALLAGRRLPPAEIADLLRDAGVPESAVGRLVCTAKYESSFYAGAQNRNTNGTTDWGLFQINDRYWLKPCGVTRQQLLDPATNVRCAAKVYDQQGIGAWYGYKAHRSECDRYKVPATTEPGGQVGGAGEGCRSATLSARVDQGECVQSSSNSLWYQCYEGTWYRIADKSGPAGSCTEEHPLP
jgi:lysozyme C